MNPSFLKSLTKSKAAWLSMAAVALMAWTCVFHWSWTKKSGPLHGVPAFFLGLLLLVLANAVIQCCLGVFPGGWRWFVRREALRGALWTAGFAVSIVVLFYNVELWRGKRAWAEVVREAQRCGEPLAIEAVTPPPVPDEQNFARAPLFAPLFQMQGNWNQLTNPEMAQLRGIIRFGMAHGSRRVILAPWLNGGKTDFCSWLSAYFITNSLGPTNSMQGAAELMRVLGAYASPLEEVRAFSSRPYCQFPFDPQQQWLFFTPQAQIMRGLIELLRLRASAEMALEKPDLACADIQLALRLAGAGWIRRDQLLPTAAGLGYPQIVVDALQPIWEGLAAHRWNSEQLIALQEQLAALPLLQVYPRAVRNDALALASMTESLIPTTKAAPLQAFPLSSHEQRTLEFIRWFYPVGWSLQDQADIHRYHFFNTAPLLDMAAKRFTPERSANWKNMLTSSDPFFYVYMVPKLRHVAQEAAEGFPLAQTAVDQALLACALERFRLKQGTYPEALSALAPRYISNFPQDIMTGGPLKYRRLESDRFVLYSVGCNQSDEGGKPPVRRLDWQQRPQTMPDIRTGDWVWTQP